MFVIIYAELKEREVKKLGEQIEEINQQLSELSLDADVVNIMNFFNPFIQKLLPEKSNLTGRKMLLN